MQIRILYIINSFSRAGAEQLVFDLSKGIREKCDFVGVAALYEIADETELQMRQQLEKAGVSTFILKKRTKKDRLRSIFEVRRIVRQYQVNLIHGHCSVPMLIGKLAGKLTGTPIICTIHNTQGYSTRRESVTAWMVSTYIAIGRSVEAYMDNALHIPKNKISLIYNAVDTERFVHSTKSVGFWEEQKIESGMPILLSVGRTVEQKNQMCLLRAVRRCRDQGKPVRAVFLGRFSEADVTYQKLRLYIQQEKLDEYVYFLGVKSDMPIYLANADCFVMTSWYEGLSVAFLEAVLSGTPVITTDMPFVRELDQIAPCATIIPQDDDGALANILVAQNFQRQSLEADIRFRELFSMGRFVEAHKELYERVLQEKG